MCVFALFMNILVRVAKVRQKGSGAQLRKLKDNDARSSNLLRGSPEWKCVADTQNRRNEQMFLLFFGASERSTRWGNEGGEDRNRRA